MRNAKHKKLVDAIVDSAVGTAEIAGRSKDIAPVLGDRMSAVIRGLILERAAGHITMERATALFREAYVSLLLGGFITVAQDVIDHSESSVLAVHTEGLALGAELLLVEKVSKPDFLQRELDKAQ